MRFKVVNSFIFDNVTNGNHYVDSEANREYLCDLLNELWDLFNESNEKVNSQNDLINELYKFRLLYNALLFNNWAKTGEVEVYKSKKHHDGSIPFEEDEGEWFIVVGILPTGEQITNHYAMEYWDYFKIPSYPCVKDVFDGHTPSDVLYRLEELLK